MQSFNRIKKGPLIISIILLAFSCFAFFFIYNGLIDIGKSTEEYQAKWQEEAIRRNEAKTLEHTMKSIAIERALLETHFAKESDVVPFLNILESLAEKANTDVEISSVSVLKDMNGLVVEMKTAGSFTSIYKLIKLLENSPYQLEFNSVNLSANNLTDVSDSGFPQWEASLKIKLLSFIP